MSEASASEPLSPFRLNLRTIVQRSSRTLTEFTSRGTANSGYEADFKTSRPPAQFTARGTATDGYQDYVASDSAASLKTESSHFTPRGTAKSGYEDDFFYGLLQRLQSSFSGSSATVVQPTEGDKPEPPPAAPPPPPVAKGDQPREPRPIALPACAGYCVVQ